MSADDNEVSFHSLLPEITVGLHDVESPCLTEDDLELEHFCSPSQYPLDDHDGFLKTDQLPFSMTERRNSTGEWERGLQNRLCTARSEEFPLARPWSNSVSQQQLDVRPLICRDAITNIHLSATMDTEKAIAASSCSSIYFSVHDDSSSSFSSSSNQPTTEQELSLTPKAHRTSPKPAETGRFPAQRPDSQLLSDGSEATLSSHAPSNGQSLAAETNVSIENSLPGITRGPRSIWTELLKRRLASDDEIGDVIDDEAEWPELEEQYSSLPSSRSSVESESVTGPNGRRNSKPPMGLGYFRDKPRGEPMGSENELAAPVTSSSVSDRLAFMMSSTNKRNSIGAHSPNGSTERDECSDDSDSDNAKGSIFAVPVRNSVLRSFWLRDCIEGADSVEEQQQARVDTTAVAASVMSLTTECDPVVDNVGNVRPPLVGQSEESIATNAPVTSTLSEDGTKQQHSARSISDEEMPSKTTLSSASKDSLALRVTSLLKSTIQNISGTRIVAEDSRVSKSRPGPCPIEGQLLGCTCAGEETNRMRHLSSESDALMDGGCERTEQNSDCGEVGENATSVQQRDHFSERSNYHLVSDDARAGLQLEPSSVEPAASKADFTGDQRGSSPSVMSVSSVASSKRLEWDSGADVGYGGPKVLYGLSTLERMAIGSCCSAIQRMEPEGKSSLVKDNPIGQTSSGLLPKPYQLPGTSAASLNKLGDGVESNDATSSSDLDGDSDIVQRTGEIAEERLANCGLSNDEVEEELEVVEKLEMVSPENGELAATKPPHSRIVLLKSKGLRSSSLTDLTDAVIPRTSDGEVPVRKIQHSCSISNILEGQHHVGHWGSISSTGSVVSSHSSKTIVGAPLLAKARVTPTSNPFCSTAIHDSVSGCLLQRLSFHTPSYETSRDRTATPPAGNLTFTVLGPVAPSHLQQPSHEQQQTPSSLAFESSRTEASTSKQCSTRNESEIASPPSQAKPNQVDDVSAGIGNPDDKAVPDENLVAFTKAFVAKLCPASDVQRKQRLLKKILEDFGVVSAIDDDRIQELHPESHDVSSVDAKIEAPGRQVPLEKSSATPSEKIPKCPEVMEGFKILLPQATTSNPIMNVAAKGKPQSIAILKPYSPPNSNLVFYAPVNIRDLGNMLVGQLGSSQDIGQASVLCPGTVLGAGDSDTITESALREMGVRHDGLIKGDARHSVVVKNEKLDSDREQNARCKVVSEPVGQARLQSNSSCYAEHNHRETPTFFSSGSAISNFTLLERLPANGDSASTLESSKERPTDIGAAFGHLESRDGAKSLSNFRNSYDERVSTVGSLADSARGMSRKLRPDGKRFRDKIVPSSQMYTNSSTSTANESMNRHRKARYAYHSVQQRISYTSESSSKDTSDRTHLNCYSSSRRFVQHLQTMDSLHPEGLSLVKELIREQRKSYIKKLQKEVLWLERIEAILQGTELNYNSIPHKYGDSRSSFARDTIQSAGQHASPRRTRNKKSRGPAQVSSAGSVAKNAVPLKTKALVKHTKDFGQSFPTPVTSEAEISKHVHDARLRNLFSVGVQTSFESSDVSPDLVSSRMVQLNVISKDRPVISIPLATSKKEPKRDALLDQRSAVYPNRTSNKSHLTFHQKSSLALKPSRGTPVAWFLPFDDALPRRLLIRSGSQNAWHQHSVSESLFTDHLQSLQEVFRMKKPRVIERLTSRQQEIQLAASRRRNVGLPDGYNANRRPRKYTVPLPISSQHHNPQSRNLTHYEMREQTEKVYQGLAEVADKNEVKKREDVYKTNRLMAQIYKKKLQQKVLKGKVSLLNTQKCL